MSVVRMTRRRGMRLCVAVASLALLAAIGPPLSSAATSAGELFAFGDNFSGQLGNATNNNTSAPNPAPTPVVLPGASGPVATAAAGGSQSLVLTSTGQLFAFGFNKQGQLGRTPNEEPNPTPALVTLPGATGTPAQIAAGSEHSLVLTSSGQLFAFGSNLKGQLGNETNLATFNPNATPTPVNLPEANGPVVRAAAGWEFSLALTSTGQLYGFGNDSYGQLCTGTSKEASPAPALVSLPTGSTVTQIAAGINHTLILTSSGQLYTCGNNKLGQLGIEARVGTEEPNPTPTHVILPGATGPIVQVAAGGNYSLALTSTGQLYAFGENRYGQLGNTTNNNTENATPTPTLVALAGIRGFITEIAAGLYNSLVVTSSGELWAFGENNFGALGILANSGTVTPNPTPTLVGFPEGATVDAVARGTAFHALAVIANLSLVPGSLPGAALGLPYTAQVRATGGAPPYRWSASALPPGLSIGALTGVITGTPTATGNYSPTITVTDADGIEVSAVRPITVLPPPVVSLVVPRVTRLHQSAPRWREGRALARSTRRKTRKRAPVGTTFSFRLNERATVEFAFAHLLAGRKLGKRCLAPSRRNRHGRPCVRSVAAGTLTVAGRPGANEVHFAGRISLAKRLRRGRYAVVVTAVNAAGQRSTPRRLGFTIVA